MDRKTWIVNEAKKIDEKIREIPRAYREVPLVQGSRSIEELHDHLINDPYPEETRDLHRAFHLGEMNVLAKLAGGLEFLTVVPSLREGVSVEIESLRVVLPEGSCRR